jgi:hypothetical protein
MSYRVVGNRAFDIMIGACVQVAVTNRAVRTALVADLSCALVVCTKRNYGSSLAIVLGAAARLCTGEQV